MKYVSLLSLFLLATACTEAPQTTAPPVYFDVAGYVQGQIAALSARQPQVSKRTRLGDKTEQLITRQVNWSRELDLFAQADINKPALRNSYTIRRPDSLTYLYTLKPAEKQLTVRSLLVRLDAVTRKPHRIEAVLTTTNPLYSAEKQVVLESGPQKNTAWAITHYRLRGYQHLRVADKHTFDVEATVQH